MSLLIEDEYLCSLVNVVVTMTEIYGFFPIRISKLYFTMSKLVPNPFKKDTD